MWALFGSLLISCIRTFRKAAQAEEGPILVINGESEITLKHQDGKQLHSNLVAALVLPEPFRYFFSPAFNVSSSISPIS